MASISINSQLWPLRVIAVSGLAFLLAFGSLTPVFAEEAGGEPPTEEAGGEPPTEEAGGEPPTEEAGGEPPTEYVPPPGSEGVGGWALVDPSTGQVLGVHVCDISVCGPNGSWGGRLPGTDYVYRFQTRATPDGNVAGWGNSTFDERSGTFRVGDGENSFRIVPEKTSRNADGAGRSYDIGSGIVDIRTDRTFRSGDTSANLRTYQSDPQSPWLDVTLNFPSLGGAGSLLSYGLWAQTNQASERPTILDQISRDVDSALVAEGYVTTETTLDEETGEETATEVLDSSNGFVVAIREVTSAVVDWLSSRLGFGRE
jgi:hypothetical protein